MTDGNENNSGSTCTCNIARKYIRLRDHSRCSPCRVISPGLCQTDLVRDCPCQSDNDPDIPLAVVRCPGDREVICGNGTSGPGAPGERQVNDPRQDIGVDNNITQSETSLAAWGQYILFGFNDSNCARFNENISGFAFSSDTGLTWSDCGSMPHAEGVSNHGDPVIAVDSQGVFYYAHLGEAVDEESSFIQISTATVNENRRLRMRPSRIRLFGSEPQQNQDKEWITVGPDRARPGEEALFVVWTDFKNDLDSIRFAKLSTGVEPQILIPEKDLVLASLGEGDDVSGSYVVVATDGTIYVFYENISGPIGVVGYIAMVRSEDGGETFSAPIIVSSVVNTATDVVFCEDEEPRQAILVRPRRAIRTNEFPAAAVGPDGTIYVVWNDGINLETEGHIDIYMAYSKNKGTNWTKVHVTNGPTHAIFPSVAADARGAHIQYTRFRGGKGVGNGTFALYMKNFSTSGVLDRVGRRISRAFSRVPQTVPENFDPALACAYMGDYNQIIPGPNDTLFHSWSDNRNARNGNNPDVFFIQTTP